MAEQADATRTTLVPEEDRLEMESDEEEEMARRRRDVGKNCLDRRRGVNWIYERKDSAPTGGGQTRARRATETLEGVEKRSGEPGGVCSTGNYVRSTE